MIDRLVAPDAADLTDLAARLARRELSPVDVVEHQLAAIDRLNPVLNAHITILGDSARAAAARAEREIAAGQYRGPLHGVPVSVKDLYWTRDVRTTAGSRVLRDWVPTEDALVVERLRAAGAIILAKANMLEFAYASVHPDYGPTRNPWDLTRTTSGSSGGSAAAVAAGLDYGSFGSDTGGSIRIPAAFCGVVGLKPSYGRVSRFGVVPLSWTLDHVGPFGRSVRDVALLLQAVAGFDGGRDPYTSERAVPDYAAGLQDRLDGVRVGVLSNFMDPAVDAEVRAAVQTAVAVFGSCGADIRELSIPELEAEAIGALMPVLLAESTYSHRAWLDAHRDDYTPTVLERLEAGQAISAVAYFEAIATRQRIRDHVRAVQQDVDVLVLPTTPFPATPLESTTLEVGQGEQDLTALIRMTAPFDLTGQPALSVPCGFTAGGLPIGMQLVGRDFEDDLVLRAGSAYQARTDWHLRRPPVSA